MKRQWVHVLITVSVGWFSQARAQDVVYKGPLQLSIMEDVQVISAENGVAGMRLCLPYGKNAAVTGLDLGFVNEVDVNAHALGVGFVLNRALEDFHGVQMAPFNTTGGRLVGFQIGLFWNDAEQGVLFQLAGVNDTNAGVGVQVAGLVNRDTDFEGIQIAGLANDQQAFSGIQMAGILNRDEAHGVGFQVAGLLNLTKELFRGVQVAAINCCDTLDGVQIGLFNYSSTASGLQLGVVNVIEHGAMPFFPFINIGNEK